MNEQTEQVLNKLSEKFGVAEEELWKILIDQAKISALTNSSIILLFIGLTIIFLYSFLSTYKESEKDARGVAFFSLIFFILTIVMVVYKIGDIVAGFFNPEYWALKQLLP